MSSLLVENKQQNKEGEEPHRKVKVCFQGRRSTNLPAGLTSVVSFQDVFVWFIIICSIVFIFFIFISLVGEGGKYGIHVPPHPMVSTVEDEVRR